VGECDFTDISSMDKGLGNVQFTKGQEKNLGSIVMKVSKDEGTPSCMAVFNAKAPDDTVIPAIYTAEYVEVPLCPSCRVTEIPSIIHPIGIYSGSSAEAEASEESASEAVSSLIAASADVTSQAIEDMKQNAINNLEAARSYLPNCAGGDSNSCRLVQYYSRRATSITSDAMNAICLQDSSYC
jgi:hypothetical protein